ncbi:MAG: phosphatidylserine decarboxylase [Candidatus Thermoplasmatota archaeon]|nr:phosphatidylserine decarboxylase [Candidatus Thermoplasmatota archaeon]
MIAPRCLGVALAPLPVIVVLAVLTALDRRLLALLLMGLAAQVFFLFFFRDPHRNVGQGLVSPADGTVVEVSQRSLSIFMNLWNVHVNRVPLAGTIRSMQHLSGEHRPAFGDVSRNERLTTVIETDQGEVSIAQIAGVFARRIVPYVEAGQRVEKGQRLGIIRFGSRVEVRAPPGIIWTVSRGDRVRAGQSIGLLG